MVEIRPPEWVHQQAPIGSEAKPPPKGEGVGDFQSEESAISQTSPKHPSRSPKLSTKIREVIYSFDNAVTPSRRAFFIRLDKNIFFVDQFVGKNGKPPDVKVAQ